MTDIAFKNMLTSGETCIYRFDLEHKKCIHTSENAFLSFIKERKGDTTNCSGNVVLSGLSRQLFGSLRGKRANRHNSLYIWLC